MNIQYIIVPLVKRFPLAISRGVRKGSRNLFVRIEEDGIVGWGEMSPGKSEGAESPEEAIEALKKFQEIALDSSKVRENYELALAEGIPPCAVAALDIALWDLKAKKANMPLYQLLGFSAPKVPTSVTLGINPPDVVRARIPMLLNGTGVKSLKIKLGSPEGIEADKLMYQEVVNACDPYEVKLRVDANGGWSVEEAKEMMEWLSKRKCEYIEQPLVKGNESGLPQIFKNRPMPIYVDESCRFASDIPNWSNCVDGVNLKLMKCGGISGALDIISTAKAFGLKLMIGCMGESSVSISAGAAVSGALDHIDLDAHLNLAPDPSLGVKFVDGVIVPNELPGHGAQLQEKYYHAES